MSAPVVPVVTGNQFFDRLPDDATTSIFEFLKGEKGSLARSGDDKAVVATARVCRDWQNNPVLENEREEASARLHQRINLQNTHSELVEQRNYPQQMIQLFRNCNLPIARLPVLDFGDRMGGTGYVDMLRPADMTHPIMRFKDQFGRPGIAFHVEGHADGQVEIFDQQRQIRDLSGVLATFKRYTNGDSWKVGMGGILNSTMSRLHNDRHNDAGHVGPQIMACPNCPSGMQSGDNVSYNTLSDLLAGRDPLFRIAQGYVPPQNLLLPAQAQDDAMAPVENQIVARNSRGLSGRAAVATALAVLVIAYLVNYALTSGRN
jgi:hypothetical protein